MDAQSISRPPLLIVGFVLLGNIAMLVSKSKSPKTDRDMQEVSPDEDFNDIGVWIGALSALGIYSVLIKDNPFYTMVEHLFVGSFAGIAVVVGINTFLNSAWSPMIEGKYLLIIPILLGILLYSRYFEDIA